MEIREKADLAAILARGETLSIEQCVDFFGQLADQVSECHRRGLLHREIALDQIGLDQERGVVLLDEPVGLVSFGGSFAEEEACPPELRIGSPLELSCDLADARRTFLRAGLPGDPLRIDVYQLSVVLCRLLSQGRPLAEYERSPRIQATVPKPLREILDLALGAAGDDGSSTLTALVEKIQEFRDGMSDPERTNAAVILPQRDASPGRNNGEVDAADRETPSTVDQEGTDSSTDRNSASNRERGSELPFARLGHFRIVELLGRGGMGDVYRAFDEPLGRWVAIKVLPPELSRHDDFVQRFRAEAAAAARLIHPGIVPIHFIGEDQGAHYFAMQYVEGESLAEILARRGKLPWEEAVNFIEQILGALGAAHAQGFVHRDIKPGNLLWDRRQQRAMLADFGIAKAIEASVGLTATGTILGTADYFSPEQGRGQPVDQRSDLYSVGCVLYRMLSGSVPFSGDSSTALVFQHVYEAPRPLRDLAPDVPPALSMIVQRLMCKDPDDRYSDAAAVIAALKGLTAVGGQQDIAALREVEVNTAASELNELPSSVRDNALADDRAPRGSRRAPPVLNWGSSPNVFVEANGWTGRLAGLFDWIRLRMPQGLARLQNTQQQVDGAVVEYERREQNLQALAREAEQVCAELLLQEKNLGMAAVEARRRIESASAEDRSGRDEQALAAEGEFNEAAGLRRQQQEQLSELKMQLAKTSASLHKMRSQRDILNARLRAVQAANPELAGTNRRWLAWGGGRGWGWGGLDEGYGGGRGEGGTGSGAWLWFTHRGRILIASVCALLLIAAIYCLALLTHDPITSAVSQPPAIPLAVNPPLDILPPPLGFRSRRQENFTGAKFDAASWIVTTTTPAQVGFAGDSLHAIIPPRKTGIANVTMTSKFRLEGDFDIRVDYSLKSLPRPKTLFANVAILIEGPDGAASTIRTNHSQLGNGYARWFEPAIDPKKKGFWKNVPTTDVTGTLRLHRASGRLHFLAAGPDKNFRDLGTVDYGTGPIDRLHLVVVAPAVDDVVDVSLDDVSVEAESIVPVAPQKLSSTAPRLIGEPVVAPPPYELVRQAQSHEPAARYELLKNWVFPNEGHSNIRLWGDLSPRDPAPPSAGTIELRRPAKWERRVSTGGETVVPCLELVRTAKQLGRLDELEQLAGAAPRTTPTEQRVQVSFRAILALARGNAAAAKPLIRQVFEAAASADVNDPEEAQWIEAVVGLFALEHPPHHRAGYDILQTLASKFAQRWSPADVLFNRKRQHWWGLGEWVLSGNRLKDFGRPPGLKQWQAVSNTSAESRGRGWPQAQWVTEPGDVHHLPGHTDDFLYFAMPLRGEFEVTCEVSNYDLRETRIMYAGHYSGVRLDLKSIDHLRLNGRSVDAVEPVPNTGREQQFRLTVRDNQATSFINGTKLYTLDLSEDSDPWLAIHSFHICTGTVRNLRVTGSPEVPRELKLLNDPQLLAWQSSYYADASDSKNGDWRMEEGVAIGRKRSADGHGRERLLRYHRPLLEDGEIEYEFFYEPEKVEVHPALDRLALLLDPDGVKVHWLTDGPWERTGLAQDNAEDDPKNAHNATALPLRLNEWNRVQLVLHGDSLRLALNGETIYVREVEATNLRTFGLFHFADQTEARVRNVTYRGTWPTALPSIEQQELAVSPASFTSDERRRFTVQKTFDFRGTEPDLTQVWRIGAASEAPSGPEGLRVALPAGQVKSATAGVLTKFKLQGDFEVVARFKSLKADTTRESDILGAGVDLHLEFDGPAEEQLFLERRQLVDGRQVLKANSRRTLPDSIVRWESPGFDCDATAGQLKFVRRGGKVSYLFAPGGSSEFRLLDSRVVGTDDVKAVGFVARAWDKASGVTVVLEELSIQAQASPQ